LIKKIFSFDLNFSFRLSDLTEVAKFYGDNAEKSFFRPFPKFSDFPTLEKTVSEGMSESRKIVGYAGKTRFPILSDVISICCR
jgi:hypothetical protein